MDKALLALILPLVFGLLIFAWLCYASAGGRRIDLRIKGLGISIDLDTSPADCETPINKDLKVTKESQQ